MEEIELVIEV